MADGNAVQSTQKDSRGNERGRTGPVTFFRQVVAELRKVVWPTQKELTTYFFVVMVFVVVLVTMVSLLDVGFGKLVFQVFAGNNTTTQ